MRQQFLDLFASVNEAHRALIDKCVHLEQFVMRCGDLTELADLAYVLRESYTFEDGSRKELKKLSELVAKLFYVLWANDPTVTSDVIVTSYCRCTPDPKVRASVPKPDQDPERYAAILRLLGVPEEAISSGTLRVGWDEFGDLLTKMQRDGKPIPDCIEPTKTYTEYRLSITCRTKLPTGASGGAAQDEQSRTEESENDSRNRADRRQTGGDDDIPF